MVLACLLQFPILSSGVSRTFVSEEKRLFLSKRGMKLKAQRNKPKRKRMVFLSKHNKPFIIGFYVVFSFWWWGQTFREIKEWDRVSYRYLDNEAKNDSCYDVHQASISSTFYEQRLSTKDGQVVSLFLCFWDLRVQKLLVECWWNWTLNSALWFDSFGA